MKYLMFIFVACACAIAQTTPTQADLDNAKLKAAADAATLSTDIQNVDAIANQVLGAELAAIGARLTALEKAVAALQPAPPPPPPPSGLSIVQPPAGSTYSISAFTAVAGHQIFMPYDTLLTDPDFANIVDQKGVCAVPWQHVAPAQPTSTTGEHWGAWWCSKASGIPGDLEPSDIVGVVKLDAIEISNATQFAGAQCTPNPLSVTPTVPSLLILGATSQTANLTFSGWTQQIDSPTHWNEYIESQLAVAGTAYSATATAPIDGCIFSIQ